MKTSSPEILEKALLPPAQAQAILKVMEVEIAYGHETLATKGDLLATRVDLREAFANLRADFADLRADFANLKVEFSDLRAAFMRLEAEFRTLEARVDGKIAASEGRLTRWVFTCILGQTAVLAGLGYFFLTHVGR